MGSQTAVALHEILEGQKASRLQGIEDILLEGESPVFETRG
jgi:hypothetical protein